jgi:hypothetical protein
MATDKLSSRVLHLQMDDGAHEVDVFRPQAARCLAHLTVDVSASPEA